MVICADVRNLQKNKHHCNSPPIWAWCQCGQTQYSPQWRHMKTCLEFAKELLNHPQTQFNQFQASCLMETSSAHHHMRSTIPKVKCSGSSLRLWGCFSAAGTEGLVRVEEKLNTAKYWERLNENLVQGNQNLRLGRRFIFKNVFYKFTILFLFFHYECMECRWMCKKVI